VSNNTAIKTRVLEDWKSDAALYRVSPPVIYGDEVLTDYVIVSSIDLQARRADDPSLALWDMFFGIDRTEETLVFPADSDAEVLDWDELALVDVRSHFLALTALGYEVAE
jgi:hypothetical protein